MAKGLQRAQDQRSRRVCKTHRICLDESCQGRAGGASRGVSVLLGAAKGGGRSSPAAIPTKTPRLKPEENSPARAARLESRAPPHECGGSHHCPFSKPRFYCDLLALAQTRSQLRCWRGA